MEATTQNENAVALSTDTAPAALNLFSIDMFRDAWKVATELSKSKLIPQTFQGNPPDCIIAMEMAQRIGASIFSVMQSLYIVHGRPGWSAQFIIAALNSCGRFSPLRFDMVGDGDSKTCTAWALEKGTGEKLTGPPVSIDMAKKEGWHDKNGSKWKTMPELMLRYRAATFFGRLYAPDILMGMRTAEELHDTDADVIDVSATVADDLTKRFLTTEEGDKVDTKTGEVEPCVSQNEENDTQPDLPLTSETQNQHEPEQPKDTDARTEKVKAFKREINVASTNGSLAIDQWRMKHHKRVERELGSNTDEYGEVMDYAEMTYQEMVKAEQSQQNGGKSNGNLF